MLRPQVLGFGDAHEFLAGLKPHEQAAADLPPRLLVGAFLFGQGPVSGPDIAERCVEELRDVLVFAIHASTASQRDVIAPRIAEFAERPIQFGDSVVLSAKRLEHASIRATLQEDLL